MIRRALLPILHRAAKQYPVVTLMEPRQSGAYIEGKRFRPVEVKWTQQLRPKDLKQIAKYGNGKIWARTWSTEEIGGIPVEPLPLALYRLGGASRLPG